MSLFAVTTAQVVYERYIIEAGSEEEAHRLVSNPAVRVHYPSQSVGDNNDEAIIDVQEIK